MHLCERPWAMVWQWHSEGDEECVLGFIYSSSNRGLGQWTLRNVKPSTYYFKYLAFTHMENALQWLKNDVDVQMLLDTFKEEI